MDKLTIDSVKNFESDVDYTTVLDNFEGPLDLLLYLIDKDQIEIKDIFVSQVTEQFLSYMKGLQYIDVDKASEYLNIAATIINIKARSLLPPTDDDFDVEEYYDDDPEQELIQALEEYKLLKEEADKLKERETVGYFFKEPDKEFATTQIVYKDFTLDGLIKAFTQMMLKRETAAKLKVPTKQIARDVYTVRDKIGYIRKQIGERELMKFDELFSEEATTPEVVTTFQALLELLKHQFILVEQDELFATITIKKNPNISEDEEIGEIDEYN